MDDLIRLFPQPAQETRFKGAYLAHDLRQHYGDSGEAFVYTNFVVSIDGRIAIPHPSGSGLMVPKDTANERDWRLYQELAAQADIIISSGRYLRDWADGRAQEILEVDDPRFFDLRDWRRQMNIPPQPDIAIISASLRFPIPEVLTTEGRKVVVFTTADPDPARVSEIEDQAGRVIVAGENSVDGAIMIKKLNELGYKCVYSGAGPRIMHLLLAGGVLNRIYLTFANRVLGGSPYSSLVEGPLLSPTADFTLNSLYLDRHSLGGLGQLFFSYDRV